MEQELTFKSQGMALAASFSLPSPGSPCVVLSHGLESHKDGNKWLVLDRALNEAGFACLRFTYSGCGEGRGKSEGDFENTSLSGRIQDYRAALDFAQSMDIDIDRLGTIGSSLGGMVALASRDSRIKAMVVVATPCILSPDILGWLDNGRSSRLLTLPSGRRIKAEGLEDTRQFDILKAASETGCPLLVIHGAEDEAVPLRDGYRIYEAAREPKALEVISGGDHSLDGPEALERLVGLSVEWFLRYLGCE